MIHDSFADQNSTAYIEKLYAAWQENPENVDTSWRRWFAAIEKKDADISSGQNGASPPQIPDNKKSDSEISNGAIHHIVPDNWTKNPESPLAEKQGRVNHLIATYRDFGYMHATINPLRGYTTPELTYIFYTMEGKALDFGIENFGLQEEDLDKKFFFRGNEPHNKKTLREIIAILHKTYCGNTGLEGAHIQNRPMYRWLINEFEKVQNELQWSTPQKHRIQKDLIKAEEFEHFIHKNFIGQKRFSLEGSEVLIPALRYLIDSAAHHNLQEIVLGMAHRGRLNVFTNALRKPAVETFVNFIDYKPHTYGGSGDVKYHLGHSFDLTYADGNMIHISLVANPSHLEAVGPVVEGKCRGIQRQRNDRHRKKVLPVLIHGDAAFSGQGVVMETFNLSQLRGYRTGGTIHIIVNNQIGFTTASRDSRSTYFATDIAKSMPIPIFHVNGDDPEAILRAINIAMHYRYKFAHDVVIDIFSFRKLGHNEADEPSFTHPIMYSAIDKNPGVRTLYGTKLAEENIYTQQEQDQFNHKYNNVLKEELEKARSGIELQESNTVSKKWSAISNDYSFDPVDTSYNIDTLTELGTQILQVPPNFKVHEKLTRLIRNRRTSLETREKIDWAFAETLAFASLVAENYSIRLSGEDCARGTFSQRHAIWWDIAANTPKNYCPLCHIAPQNKALFSIYDSPLSEFSVLGFDYGYSLVDPNIMVLWEAQFGDFVNGAQVIIDQFIVAAEEKWNRKSGIVLLLPHGYEGQGAEHSSAHLERFLQLCAGNNIQVAYPTTPAQYFHLLRKQMKQPFRKPLIVMTPKSLLRLPQCQSSLKELAEGTFQMVIDDTHANGTTPTLDPSRITRIICCAGKIYYDLLAHREKAGRNDIAIIRIEQLYPFPEKHLADLLTRYSSTAEIIWCQEESQNRGAWSYIVPYFTKIFRTLRKTGNPISVISRRMSASPATGSHKQHKEELDTILQHAFK